MKKCIEYPYVGVYSDEDGQVYVHVTLVLGITIQVQIEEADLRRIGQEIGNELDSLDESRR